eukprot:3193940-Alexandrium_andersonii.AAC.1
MERSLRGTFGEQKRPQKRPWIANEIMELLGKRAQGLNEKQARRRRRYEQGDKEERQEGQKEMGGKR